MPIPDEMMQAALESWRGQGQAQPPPEFHEPDLGQPPPPGPSPFTPPSQFDPTTLEFDPTPPELERGGGIPQLPLEAPTDYFRPPPPPPPFQASPQGPAMRHVPVFRPDIGPGVLSRMRGG